MAFYRPARYQKPLVIVLLLALVLLPALDAWGQAFYISFATRILIFAGGQQPKSGTRLRRHVLAHGHAAFFGAGAMSRPSARTMESATPCRLPLAMTVAVGLLALVVGAISLHARAASISS